MARLHGANGSLVIGGTTYYSNGGLEMPDAPRVLNARATGDDTAVDVIAGLADDYAIVVSGVMIEAASTLSALNGTLAAVTYNEGTTAHFVCTSCLITVSESHPAADMITATVTCKPQVLPTTPAFNSSLAM
jgi:hypothetical protein